jgi:hypothetical protein
MPIERLHGTPAITLTTLVRCPVYDGMLCHAEVPILAADGDQVRHATGLVGDCQELVRLALQSHDVEPAEAERGKMSQSSI